MAKNNSRAALAALAFLFLVRTAYAQVEITDARAELAADEPRRIEIFLVLRNGTGHDLKLQKLDSTAADVVLLKQRSIDAEGRPHLWPVARFEVPRGSSTRLVPEGRFLQLTELAPGVRVGQEVSLTLTFEDEKPVTIRAMLEAARPR